MCCFPFLIHFLLCVHCADFLFVPLLLLRSRLPFLFSLKIYHIFASPHSLLLGCFHEPLLLPPFPCYRNSPLPFSVCLAGSCACVCGCVCVCVCVCCLVQLSWLLLPIRAIGKALERKHNQRGEGDEAVRETPQQRLKSVSQ